ncbi:ATP-binding protein [Cellulosimicrobium sp. PMB13]|uniref:sacsin N-terminal ATP-binding-like domain-containing protein n=1 Tax=Cellulosimicrobium sp. PMB13 TaxID=3120158 RepID=UPI003F4C46F1
MSHDPLGTAALRRAVLEAWRSSPTRLREDANTEEDHAHGSYRDRVVVELAQNAADAAARAGVPGRLVLSLRPSGHRGTGDTADESWVLRAANTGAPLDAAGVASLAAMRASATGERGAGTTVGRFGVGFAALRSVSDEIRIGAGERAVGFALDGTRVALEDVVRDDVALAADVARRGDRLPVLRLPFPAVVEVPDGHDTVVEVVLRDAAALAAVRAELADVGDPLLLALTALREITVDDGDGPPRRVADVEERWTTVRRGGLVDPELLAGRPVEERSRTSWAVTWALPRAADPPRGRDVLHVVHAPTPTDEPATFPALLLASFPLDPSRRHVSPGALTEHVARSAGEAYAELLGTEASARGVDVLSLVPTGLPAGAVDALVRDAATDALRATPLLPVAGSRRLVRPIDARVLSGDVGTDPAVLDVLGVPDLVAVPRHHLPVARSLGVGVLDLADVVDDLRTPVGPDGWRGLYDALAPHAADPSVREALGALPVPLADGRTARGARGLVLLDAPASRHDADELRPAGARSALTPHDAAALGLRVVDPDAAHPLLERLGARRTSVRDLVADDAVRARVLAVAAASDDEEDVTAAVESLLALVGAAVATGLDAAPFWWGELPLATADGETAAARSLVLPGSWASGVLDLDVVGRDVVEHWGEPVLRAVGVVVGPAVHRVRDVLTPSPGEDPVLAPHGAEGWLSDWSGYLEHLTTVLGAGVFLGDLAAVADLDAVADDAWPEVLAAIAADPAARAALLEPVRSPAGREAPSYTAWWLRGELGGPFARGDVPFLRPVPPELAGLDGPETDEAVLVALGGVRGLDLLVPDEWVGLLDALPDLGTRLDAADAVALWRALASLAARGEELDPAPDRLPALGPRGVEVADAAEVVVAADPMWSPLRPVVPAPAALVGAVADLLDVAAAPLAPPPDAAGTPRDLPEPVRRVLGDDAPGTWCEHPDLRVEGVRVPWWVVGSGAAAEVHVGAPRALAPALAASAGRFDRRHLVEEVLRDPESAERAVASSFWDHDA